MAPPPPNTTKSLNLTHEHVEKFLLKLQNTWSVFPPFSTLSLSPRFLHPLSSPLPSHPLLSSPLTPSHISPLTSRRRLSLTRPYSSEESAPKPLDLTRTEASLSRLYANASRNDHSSFYREWTNFLVLGGHLDSEGHTSAGMKLAEVVRMEAAMVGLPEVVGSVVKFQEVKLQVPMEEEIGVDPLPKPVVVVPDVEGKKGEVEVLDKVSDTAAFLISDPTWMKSESVETKVEDGNGEKTEHGGKAERADKEKEEEEEKEALPPAENELVARAPAVEVDELGNPIARVAYSA
jgi:hypothetical protein